MKKIDKNIVTIATCNILAQDPYSRHCTARQMPVEKRRSNLLATLEPLMYHVDIFCFQEWDYSLSGYCNEEVQSFFAWHEFELVRRESENFGVLIAYKGTRFNRVENSYDTALFGESLIYGYLSIALERSDNRQIEKKMIRVTTTHVPYYRKKGVLAEDFLNKIPNFSQIPCFKDVPAIICGDFNAPRINFASTPFHDYRFAHEDYTLGGTHRLDDDEVQTVDYLGVKGGKIVELQKIPQDTQLLLSHVQDTADSSYFSDHALLYGRIELV